jgi:hypothetical protein
MKINNNIKELGWQAKTLLEYQAKPDQPQIGQPDVAC